MPMPIDPNTEILRVNLAERIQQISDRASLLGQVRQSLNEEQQRVVDETQVKEMQQKSEQVETELKRKNPFLGRRRKPQKEEYKEVSSDEEIKGTYEDTKDDGSHLDLQA
ncbi:MAG: hypothetical protein ACP5UA_14035 [Candidatus Hydrogenedens sp.]